MADGFVLEGRFDDRGILEGFKRLEQAATTTGAKVGDAIEKGLGDAGRQSVAALTQELERLQRRQLRIGSDNTALERTKARINEIEAALTAVGQKPISVKADTKTLDSLRSKLKDLQSELDQTAIGSRRFQELQRSIKGVEGEISKATGQMSAFATAARATSGLLASIGAGAAITGFLKGAIQGAMELETVTRKLSNTLGQQGAGQALGFTRDLADRLGLSFKVLSGSFSSFTAAATAAGVPLEQQKGLFAAVSKAAQSLGLSNDELQGSLLALQQIASKGTVSMEELRGQLGERLPIALSAAARGLGLTTKELIKLVESGKLSSKDFFPAFTKGLEELTSASGGVPTAAQNLAKLQNAWDNLQASFGQNLLPGVTQGVNLLTEAISEYTVQQKALDLGFTAGFAGVSVQAAQAVGALDQLSNQYGLTAEQAKALFKLSALGVGATYTSTGELVMSTQQYGNLLSDLPDRVKAWAGSVSDVQRKAIEADRLAREELERQAAARQAQLGIQQKQLAASSAELQLAQGIGAAQKARLEGSITLLDAIVARQQALSGLEQAGSDVLLARNKFLQEETKSEGRKKQLKEEQKAIEADALREQVAGLAQKFEAERKSLALKQEMARLEQQLAVFAAERAVVEANMALVKAQQAGKSEQELALAQTAIQLAEGQLGIERQRSGLLGTTQALERDTLGITQKTEATKLRAQAAGKGLEASLGSQLALLDQSLTIENQRASAGQKLVEAQNANARATQVVTDAEKAHLAAYSALDQARRSGDPKAIQAALDLVGAREQELLKAQSVVQTTADQVRQQRGVVQGLQQAGVAATNIGNGIGLAEQRQQQLNASANGLGQRYDNASRQAGKITAQLEGSGDQSRILISNIRDVGKISSTAAGQAKTIAQGIQFSARGAGAITKSDFSGQFEDASLGAEAISESGIDSAVGRAASQTQNLTVGMSRAAGEAERFYRWLAQASGLPNARWAGGPVEGGTQYRVNELGQEAFLANSGRLALINRAANSTWTAPSSGVVIPAALTSQLQDQGLVGPNVNRNINQARPARGDSGLSSSVARQALAISQLTAEVRELRRKDWNVHVKLRGDGQGLSYLNTLNSML